MGIIIKLIGTRRFVDSADPEETIKELVAEAEEKSALLLVEINRVRFFIFPGFTLEDATGLYEEAKEAKGSLAFKLCYYINPDLLPHLLSHGEHLMFTIYEVNFTNEREVEYWANKLVTFLRKRK